MDLINRLKSFAIQSKRVWHVLSTPSREELKTISKISAIGILIIGAIGFIISDAIRILTNFLS